MPELPEVETTLRGIAPHVTGQAVSAVVVRQPILRWPVPPNLNQVLVKQPVVALGRRGKYLLFHFDHGVLLIHLGMSGCLRIVSASESAGRHDHVDIVFQNKILRFTDPRRFGSLHWTIQPENHPLLVHLGPEPLSDAFTADYLFSCSRKRRKTVKAFIMDSKVVVGVGNIYANESLFLAGIHPSRDAGKISHSRYVTLVMHIKDVLCKAIKQGGTTLKDFVGGDGKPGYFKQSLLVYGREDQPCPVCLKPLSAKKLGQRSTFYCTQCQH